MRKLSGVEKWCYAIGNIPYAVKDAAFGSFVVFFYTQVLGLSGTLAGIAMFIALSCDAVSDPLVGSWSDSIRSRFGRRHPLLLLGGIPTALLFLLLFDPPAGLSQIQVFVWLIVVSVLLRTALTVYFIPYQALGAELSDDYDERTVIAKARVAVAWLGGMALPAIAYGLIFQSSGEVDGRLVAQNYATYGVMSCAMAAITALICLWGTRTTIAHLPVASAQATFSIGRPLAEFRLALRNRNFRSTMGSKLAFGVCGGTFAATSLYMGTYFWEFSASQLAGLVVPTFLATVSAFLTLRRIGERYDKNFMMRMFCLGTAANFLWFPGARLAGLLPDNGHAVLYQLQLLQTYLTVFSIVGLQATAVSLIADILDQQEVEQGVRQEGVFFAASSFVLKASSGVGVLFAGIIVDVSGLVPGATPGTVPESALNTLGWFAGPGIAAGALVAWYFARSITLSRGEVATLRQRLQSLA